MTDAQKLGEAIAAVLKGEPQDVRKGHEFTVLKVAEGEGVVYGWGMVSSIKGEPYYDTDNEHIPSDVLRKSAVGFMESDRISNLQHGAEDVGTIIFGFPLTKEIAESMGIKSEIEGFMVGLKPNKETLAKFVSGELTGFSLEGMGIAEDVD